MTISAPAVLFDLDGTLVDPAGGISSGIAHALRAMDLPVPTDEVLASMIGPKLSDALLYHTAAGAHQLPDLISIYRRWYAERGIAMGRVYPGVRQLLGELRESGYALAVATQKPQGFALKVLAAHGLAESFDVICGSSDDETLLPGQAGYRSGKADIIAAALAGLDGHRAADSAQPGGSHRESRAAVMVGDRAQDVNGAHANSLPCIGVAWGFALPGELEQAGAIAVVDHAQALKSRIAAAAEVAHGAV